MTGILRRGRHHRVNPFRRFGEFGQAQAHLFFPLLMPRDAWAPTNRVLVIRIVMSPPHMILLSRRHARSCFERASMAKPNTTYALLRKTANAVIVSVRSVTIKSYKSERFREVSNANGPGGGGISPNLSNPPNIKVRGGGPRARAP